MFYGDQVPKPSQKPSARAAGGGGFTKKLASAPQLYKDQTGVIPFSNGQYCVSSGNISLDSILGGGLPLGSMVVLYEDSHSQYYCHFLKSYLAEGVVNKHQCLVVDSHDTFRSKESWTKFLP
jgi:hypothetical protein